jgi:phage regulator Rha-like protein
MNATALFNPGNGSHLDSREVAEMVGKEHRNLLRDIRSYIQIMDQNTKLKVELSDFFIESSYKDSTGRSLPATS